MRGLVRYFTGEPCSNGHVAPRVTGSGSCVVCNRIAARKVLAGKYEDSPKDFAAYRRVLQAADPLGELLRRAKGRARRKGLPFSITRADLPLPERCPCCGHEMTVRTEVTGPGRPYPRCPTIDRLDCSLGYEPGNVNIICWRCNEIKRTATEDELRAIADWMARVNRQKIRLIA